MLSSYVFASTILWTAVGILGTPLEIRQTSVTILSSAQVASYKSYTYYASAAYCSPETTKTWTCGTNCEQNSGFKPIDSGGDGAIVQYWYVGYDPALNSIIVGFQGTDTDKILPILTDGNFLLAPLNPLLFPGVSPLILTHDGFAKAHGFSAPDVLVAVQKGLALYPTQQVTVVGHSLGGALSIISSSFLALHLPDTTVIKTVTYGAPRVGNENFVLWANGNSFMQRINNKQDPIPTLPYRVMLFAGTEGEIHITDTNQWVSCPGEDNGSPQCTLASVPFLTDGNLADHGGPYDGVTIGC
ncbi:lipase [Crepidotus variabilis]|uniref:Lipase n=1 Tax=Crepidotus variabilis TaxID=179855 RepID=A0A9P6EG64_9AGAR|nr:lipase [Crepidotus variabilis]